MLNSSCAIRELEGISAFSVNILSAALGSLGNLLVCSTVYWSPRLHKAWCYFICSLSIADLMVNLVVQPMEAVLTFARMKGICDHELRDAFRLAAYITCGASLMNLAFMSVERCLAIAWPLRQRQLRHLTRRRVLFFVDYHLGSSLPSWHIWFNSWQRDKLVFNTGPYRTGRLLRSHINQLWNTTAKNKNAFQSTLRENGSSKRVS